MSFIQCKDRDEVEDKLEKLNFKGFVTEDHRIYDKVEFSDDAMYYLLDEATLIALYDLQTSIEMVTEGGHEMPFSQVIEDAKMLDESFKKALAAIKFKPLTRRKK